MARNAIDRMKKQGSAKAKENRTNRRKENAKQYGKSGMSATDKAYINGNYVKVASNKAYGYKQSVKKGEIVRGSDNDWLNDGNIYRNTSVKENQTWKNPTTQKGKQKYAILSSHKWDKANKFSDHLNFGTLDGIKTAKANQRKGKHIQNAIEYGKGIIKDTVVDGAVDFMKGVGAAGSYGVSAIAGLAEDSGNVFKAIADPKRTLKDYTQGKSYTKENIKSNKESLDRTGWGTDFSTYLNEAKARGDEETIRHLKEDGRHEDAKAYEQKVKDEKATSTKVLNATGFAMDLLAPGVVEDKVVDTVKVLSKNTAKSFKEMVNGTANLATGILPEETAKLMANSKKYAGKGVTGASDDVFFSGKKGNTSIDKLLDNQHSKVMDRANDTIKNTIKQNPNTPNLSKYLDELDNTKPYKGTQRNIDGRTLNKKYTQTKDGYVPNKIPVDEVEEVTDVKAKSQQFSMFAKDGSVEGYLKQLKDPYARYENILNKFDGDIDGLAEKLDSMKPQNAKEMYDYLMKRKPNLYQELTKGSDDVTNLMMKNDKYNLRNISDELSSVDKIKELNTRYNTLNEKRILESINGKQEKIGARFKVGKGKEVFSDVVGKYLFGKLPNKSVDELELVSGKFSSMIKELDNPNTSSKVAKELNDFLFDGNNVVRNNMYGNSLREVLEYFNEIVDYQKAVQNGEEIFNFKNSNLPSEFKIFDEYGNPNLTNDLDLSRLYAPSATDSSFDIKREDLGKMFGVKNKSKEIDKPLTELFNKKKAGQTLTEEEYRLFAALKSKQGAWKKVYEEIKDLDPKEYEEYARKNFNKNAGYHNTLDELAEQQAKIDATKGRENTLLEAKRNQELGSDPSVTASPRSQNLLHNGDVDEWEQMTQNNATGNIKNIPFKQYKTNYAKELGLNYVNTKYPIQINKAKQTLQGVRSYKPVDNAISNLEKLMNKEVALTLKGKSNTREYETLRTLVKENVQRLNELGVNSNAYFDHIKQLKMNLLQDGQISKNLTGVKPSSGKVKDTVKNINPLETMHVKINGKAINNVEELTPDQLQWKYLMTEGAKTIDELFDVMPGSIPQHGDNIGSEVGNMLRPNTPLDNISKNSDEYVDDFERIIAKENEEQSLKMREALESKTDVNKPRAQMSEHTLSKIEEYSKKLNLPTPQTIDELEFNIPGVDEDGVIQDFTKANNELAPTFEQFKENISKNSDNKLPYEDSELYNVYKSWLNSWKKGLTVYNPGWHVQNFFQNKGQNYLALGGDAFKPQTEAKNILKHINGEKAKDVNIFDKKNLRSYSSDELGKLAQELGVIDSLGEDVINARGIFPKLETAIDNSKLMKALGKNEQTARLHHFLEQIKRGNTPEQAAQSVNKYLFDYSNKSKADKVMGDFVDPFWTFHKNNARLMTTSMLEHPSKINNIIRGTNGLEYGIPEEQRQNEESKYGKLQLPYANYKDSVNNAQYNYLYDEGMMPNVEDAIPLDDEAIESKLNPILRLALQQARNEGNFGNKIVDLKEGEELGWNEISKDQRAKEVLMELNPFMPNLVKALDSQKNRQEKADNGKQSQEITDKQVFHDWLNYITGNKGNWYRNLD